jgi:hypothetical protein
MPQLTANDMPAQKFRRQQPIRGAPCGTDLPGRTATAPSQGGPLNCTTRAPTGEGASASRESYPPSRGARTGQTCTAQAVSVPNPELIASANGRWRSSEVQPSLDLVWHWLAAFCGPV